MRSRRTSKHYDRPAAAGSLSILTIGSIGGASAMAQTIAFSEPAVSPGDGLSFPMAWEDFNQDGRLDVAVVADGVIKIFLNDGMGGLTQSAEFPYYGKPPFIGPPKRIVAADLDRDGAIDLSWLDFVPDLDSVVSTWYNSGDGVHGTVVQMERNGAFIGDLAVVEISGDRLPDIIVTSAAQSVGAYINRGGRTFEFQQMVSIPHSGSIRRMVIGDVDGDGDFDIAVLFQYFFIDGMGYYRIRDTLAVLLTNAGEMHFDLAAVARLPWQDDDILASDLAIGDLDGDGDLDMVAAGWQDRSRSPNVLCLLENQRSQRLRIAATYELGSGSPCKVALGDLNTNGRLDLAFADESISDESIDIFENEGGWAFAQLGPFPSAANGGGLLAADFSMDGQLDLARSGSVGLSVITNITALNGPRYEHTALVRGQAAEFVVTRAHPGDKVRFLVSTDVAGHSLGYGLLGGLTLDLREPISQFGLATADASGRAVLGVVIPHNAPLWPVTTQAVIRRGPGGVDSVKTPFRTARILP